MSELENNQKVQSPQSDLSRLLEVRRRIKARTPKFRRFESWRYARIDEQWRKPKGIDNHMRLSVKGWPHLVKVGYRVPGSVRYLHPSGLRDNLVHNLAELEVLDPTKDAARIAAGVGKRKRIELAKRAKELRIRILNGRNLLADVKSEASEEKEQAEKAEAKKSKKEKSASSKSRTTKA